MKKITRVCACLLATMTLSCTAFAAKTELFALDGRTIFVEENQIEAYTAPGMGWFLEKPVEMFSLDGRSIIVPADQVAANKEVGWYLKEELDEAKKETENAVVADSAVKEEQADKKEPVTTQAAGFTVVEYNDGTRVTVPTHFIETYKLLGWVVAGAASNSSTDSGVTPNVNLVKVYSYNGTDCEVKEVSAETAESLKAQGWYKASDEAVYAYAAFGNGSNVLGATTLLEQKKYEPAFSMVQNAIDKLESSDSNSEYITMLDYLHTQITDTWRQAANSPLGFINYWFTNRNGADLVVFEYRNVSNSRINYVRLRFDLCDKDGNVIQNIDNNYYVENIQMPPFESKRFAWAVEGNVKAVSIKNLKVEEVKFSDGTTWGSAK